MVISVWLSHTWSTDTKLMIWQKLLGYFSMDSSKNSLCNSQNNRDRSVDIHFVWGENLAVPCSVLNFHTHHEAVIRADSVWVSEALLCEICQLKNILWKDMLFISVLQSPWDSGACLWAYTKLWFGYRFTKPCATWSTQGGPLFLCRCQIAQFPLPLDV